MRAFGRRLTIVVRFALQQYETIDGAIAAIPMSMAVRDWYLAVCLGRHALIQLAGRRLRTAESGGGAESVCSVVRHRVVQNYEDRLTVRVRSDCIAVRSIIRNIPRESDVKRSRRGRLSPDP